MTNSWCAPTETGFRISVRVVPNARSTEFALDVENVRIRLAAPAVESKANSELIRFLAKSFGVRANDITLVRGDKSRLKVLDIRGGTPPTL